MDSPMARGTIKMKRTNAEAEVPLLAIMAFLQAPRKVLEQLYLARLPEIK